MVVEILSRKLLVLQLLQCCILSVSKLPGQTSGVSSPHQNKEKVHINIRPQTLIFRGTAKIRVELGSLDFCVTSLKT